MILQTVRNVLIGAPAVVALVADRINYVQRPQGTQTPDVLLTVISTVPENPLAGVPTLDLHRIQIDSFGSTYTEAVQVAAACRAALEAAGYPMESEVPQFEPDVTEYRITQDFMA